MPCCVFARRFTARRVRGRACTTHEDLCDYLQACGRMRAEGVVESGRRKAEGAGWRAEAGEGGGWEVRERAGSGLLGTRRGCAYAIYRAKRSSNTHSIHAQALAPGSRRATLPFAGKNVVIFHLGGSDYTTAAAECSECDEMAVARQ